MTNDRIKGLIVPIVTPFTPDEDVDIPSLRRLVNYLIEEGADCIWAAGTTGEFAALSDEQRITVIETIVDEVGGRVPIIANISGPGTALTVALGMAVREMGLAGVGATPPYYYPCAQDEMLEHFRHIRERVGLPLWVYNIPVTVKTPVEPATIAELAAEGTVVGVKDSSGAGEPLAQLNVLCEQGGIELYRFLGSVFRITSARAVGAHGVIPGVSSLVPSLVSSAWRAGEAGDVNAVRESNAKLAVASSVQRLAAGGSFDGSRFSGIKSALKIMGILEHDTVSRPLRQLTDEEKEPIPSILRELGLMS